MNDRENIDDNCEEVLESPNKNDEISDPPFGCCTRMFLEEVKTNVKIAFPVMITNIFQYSMNIETTSFVGRLTSTELEGVALALSMSTAFGWCVCSGMISACDTMFSQSFGSKNKKRTGLFLQRGFLLMNLIPVFLWGIHVNFEPILILLGQDPEISRVAAEFLICYAPALTFIVNYMLLAKFMQDQGCLWPAVIAGVCGNIFNICSQLLFVIQLRYGFKASAICHAASFAIMTLVEIIYILKSKFYETTWPGLQLEAFYDWTPMFTLGLAGVGHITFEVIIWEASVFMGGLIGNVQLATQSIALQLVAIMFVMYFGAGVASNIRVGQCLGANRPNQAKAAYRSGFLTTGVAVAVVASTVVSLRYQIPYIFTNKQEVIDMVVDLLPFMFLLFYIDPFSGVFAASLRGCGRQLLGCIVIFISFYILCLPLSIVLAFVLKYGIKGIWISNTIASVVSVSLCFLVLECQDWKKQAFLAQKRIMQSSLKSNDEETEGLLHTFQIDEKRKEILPSHIRTPSEPILCSTQVVVLPSPRIKVEKSVIIKKLFVAGCVFVFFFIGLIIHIYLPTSLYRPSNYTTFYKS